MIATLAIATQCILRSPFLLHHIDVLFLDSLQDIPSHLQKNEYLQGNYAPVSEEHVRVPVEGYFPPDLDGVFIRNGPNNVLPTKKRYHWFDGDGMLHSLRIRNGKALYNNQFIPTPRNKIEKNLGLQVFTRLGEMTGITGLVKILLIAPSVLRSVALNPLTVGTANTHTLMYNSKFYAFVESDLPFEVRLDKDGAIADGAGYETFGDKLDYPVSAHAKVDHHTGHLLFHSYSADAELVARDGPIKIGDHNPKSNSVDFYQGVPMNHTSWAHDMAFTENYIIVLDGSVHFEPAKILQFGASIFDWKNDHTMKIGMVSRRDGHLEWFDTNEPLSIVHTLTSWEEEDGTVVIWAPTSKRVDLDLRDHANVFHMTEIRLQPKTKEVKLTVVSTEHNIEFPRVRDECWGKSCRFGYAGWMTKATGAGQFQGWVVYDLEEKRVHKEVIYGDGENGGEPVVIPKPGSTGSNEVYIGTFVHNDPENVDYFVLYDGETTELVSRVKMPHRIPYGFHGQWVDGKTLDAHVAFHEK